MSSAKVKWVAQNNILAEESIVGYTKVEYVTELTILWNFETLIEAVDSQRTIAGHRINSYKLGWY